MNIVSFSKKDQLETAEFMRLIFREMNWDETYEDNFDNLHKYFHLPNQGFLLLVKDKERIIGTGGLVKLNTKVGLLKRFFIAKDYRGTGIAKQLLDKVSLKAKEYKLTRLVLDTSKNNIASNRFYQKHGFKLYKQKPLSEWYESTDPVRYNYYFIKI